MSTDKGRNPDYRRQTSSVPPVEPSQVPVAGFCARGCVTTTGDRATRRAPYFFSASGRVLALLMAAFLSLPTQAHSPISSSGAEQISALLSTGLLLIFWIIYWRGLRRRNTRLPLIMAFNIAAILCVFAVLGPLDDWAKTSSAAHMSQHMLLMVVIAPLWVLSRPLPQVIAGGGRIAEAACRMMLRLTRYPMMMAYLHGFIIWFWHLPYFYMLAVINPWWHLIEHLLFLVTAGWFWWAVFNSSRQQSPFALLALLFTLMHTGFLGALLTFARAPWYGEARSLADQQLAGLIMWVAGAIPYLIAAVWIGYRWYGHLQRRMDGDVKDV